MKKLKIVINQLISNEKHKKNNNKKISIKAKLILYFSILILLSSISLGFIAIQVANNIVINEAKKTLSSLSYEAAKLQHSQLQTNRKSLDTIAVMDEIQEMNWAKQKPFLKSMLKKTDFLELGIMLPDGNIRFTGGSSTKLNEADPARKVLDGDENVINFTTSPGSDELVLIQAVPIKYNNQVVGALIGRTDGDVLSEMALETRYGETGYGYIINSDGIFIGHPNRELVMNRISPIEEANTNSDYTSLAEVFKKVLTNKQGIDSYSDDNGNTFVGYAPIEGTDWLFLIAAPEREVLAALPKLVSTIIIITAIILIISIIFTYIIGSSITKPIINTVEYAKKIENLDLSENIDRKHLQKNDEIGDLAKSLQDITKSIRNIILEISNSSEQLASSSLELSNTSEKTSVAAQEVAKTVQEIAEGANEQAKNTEDGSSKAIQLGDTIEKVQDYINLVNASSNKVTKVVTDGLSEIDSLSEITQESTAAVENIYQVIMQTNESSNRIGEASSVIGTIAKQTNLLSLNATIEAARAGDAGKGFAVIAEEIAKLAEQSSRSTKIINDIVGELQGNTNNAVQTIKRVTAIANEQSVSVKNSKEKYELVAETMKDSIDAIEQLSISGNEMDQMRLVILEVLQNLSAIAEENAAASQEASASTELQTASVEEIARASDVLSELAQKLQSLVTKFKL